MLPLCDLLVGGAEAETMDKLRSYQKLIARLRRFEWKNRLPKMRDDGGIGGQVFQTVNFVLSNGRCIGRAATAKRTTLSKTIYRQVATEFSAHSASVGCAG